jgi:hypothetical protein
MTRSPLYFEIYLIGVIVLISILLKKGLHHVGEEGHGGGGPGEGEGGAHGVGLHLPPPRLRPELHHQDLHLRARCSPASSRPPPE